jgi:hypothetical protein
MARELTNYERKLKARFGWREKAHCMSEALRRMIEALAPLDFDEKRLLLRWTAEAHAIDPARLGQ